MSKSQLFKIGQIVFARRHGSPDVKEGFVLGIRKNYAVIRFPEKADLRGRRHGATTAVLRWQLIQPAPAVGWYARKRVE
jgi:hypothetical protein